MTKRKKRTKRVRRRGLGETSSAALQRKRASAGMDQKQIGLALLSFVGGAIVGAASGKLSGAIGVGAAGIGIWKKNLPVASFGAGMLIAPSLRTAAAESGTAVEGIEGFNLKDLAEGARERTVSYIQNIGRKFLPSPSQEATNGLAGSEQVTYFVNPYTRQEDQLDLSLLEKEQERVAQMAGGFADIDPTEQNF